MDNNQQEAILLQDLTHNRDFKFQTSKKNFYKFSYENNYFDLINIIN